MGTRPVTSMPVEIWRMRGAMISTTLGGDVSKPLGIALINGAGRREDLPPRAIHHKYNHATKAGINRCRIPLNDPQIFLKSLMWVVHTPLKTVPQCSAWHRGRSRPGFPALCATRSGSMFSPRLFSANQRVWAYLELFTINQWVSARF